MGYKLANIDGRAALVAGEHYYDLEAVSWVQSVKAPSKYANLSYANLT